MLNKVLLILGIVSFAHSSVEFNRMEEIRILSEVLKVNYPSPLDVNLRLCWDETELIKITKLLGTLIRSITFEGMGDSDEHLRFNTILVLDLNCPDIEMFLDSNVMRINKNLKWFFLNSGLERDREHFLIEAVDRLNLEGGSEVFFITQGHNESNLLVHQGKRVKKQ